MQTVDAAGLPIGDDHPPRIMGVLNVSEKSPYDPSVFDDPDEAAAYVDAELVGEGADIVDVGLESANKRYDVLSADQELDRLGAAVEAIERVDGDAVFSIETRYSEVADEALSRGFDMVNDVCGFADAEMPAVCEAHDAAVVKMASPPDLERPGAVRDVEWTDRPIAEGDTARPTAEGRTERPTAEGASARGGDGDGTRDWERTYVDDVYDALALNGFTDKTIVDPAFGGWSKRKTLADDRETFDRLREFRGHGHPILVSINRKNFLRKLADRSTEEALPVSLAATSMAVERGAHVVRTHDVAETRDAALVGARFSRDRVRDGRVEELDVTTVREARRHVDRLASDTASPPEAVAGESVAASATARAYEVSGLSRDNRAALREQGVAVVGTDPAFVAGPVDVLRSAASALECREGVLSDLCTAWSVSGG